MSQPMTKRFLALPVVLMLAACDSPTDPDDDLPRERQFNANAEEPCTLPDLRTGRLVASTDRIAIYEDTGNPPGGPSAAEYQHIAATVDSVAYDVNVANFGAPTDIDENGRIIILYSRAVNELTPAGANFIVGGFQYARDLFPKEAADGLGACATSNEAEMFYLLAADPTGVVNGNRRSVDYVLGSTVGVVAHELQHVINASRRLRVVRTPNWEEVVWLNEGLSHIAEELTFYEAARREPGGNLNLTDLTSTTIVNNAFNQYGIHNISRFDAYLSNIDDYGPFQENDALETRGATWALLRYMADRHGGERDFWFNLVNSGEVGLPNLQARLAASPMVWTRDWAIANYTDDAVPGVTPEYRHPSWNYRNVLSHSTFGGYPLPVASLISGGNSHASVPAGSAAYFRFAVAVAGAATVRVSRFGTAPSGPCATPPALAPGQVFNSTSEEAAALCIQGGLTGGEYLLVTFYGQPDSEGISATSQTGVTVSATGIIPPTAPPSPAVFPGAERPMFPGRPDDGGFERRLREREHAGLSGLVPGSGARGQASQLDPAAPGMHVSLVRIR
jgi:hypothetical protein